ncbi:DUF4367 domain-containing protein [Sporosarcina saromensis]|uniref:DUF4367 domain-containing protein n=1 Tax=Sporosarcina saromensis TaxID=359365 RepID=A0ABU4GAU9_9BACL|nr:DUF4367 domain-containing protein [Sporosarcina saromensis]MDW0114126.1 DUF4367 domain-containing protein [Sporosarcina saromensis]
MSKAEKRELDHIIREVLQKQMDQNPGPNIPVEEAWNQFEARRKNSKKERKPGRKKIYGSTLLIMAAACLLFFAVGTPQQGAAFNNWFVFYQKIQGSVVQIFGGNTEHIADEGAPPPSTEMEDMGYQVMDIEYVTEQLSLEEAQSLTAFNIKSPIVPASFELTSVTVVRPENQLSTDITLNFVGMGKQLSIHQKLLDGEFGFGLSADSMDTKVKELVINERQANLITFKNGVRQLIWTTQSRYYSIEGNLEEAELIAIAESM